MASKKITDLTATTSVTADDLLITVDMSGPTSYKITIADLVNNIPSNTLFSANVTVYGKTTANAATFAGNTDVNTAYYLNANNLVIKRTTTPANTTDVLSATSIGLMWSDGDYIYVQANATHNKRAAVATW